MNVTDSFDGFEDEDSAKFGDSQSIMLITIICSISYALICLCATYSCCKCLQNQRRRKVEKDTAAHVANVANNVPKRALQDKNAHSEQTTACEETAVAMPKEQEEDKELNKRSLKPERYVKRAYSILIILSIFILVAVNSLDRRSKYHLMSYLMLILCVNWNILFNAVLLSAKHLHAVRVKRKRLNDSQFLFIPYMYEEDKHRVIFCVSEMMAVSGSNTEKYFALMAYATAATTYCAALVRWSEEQSAEFTKLDVELLLFLVSNFGTMMLATWNLEPHTFGFLAHYAAAATCFCGNPIAFAIQQNLSWFSIVFMCVTVAVLIEWLILSFCFVPKRHEDLAVVHKWSKISIMNEEIMLILVNVAGIMFVYNL